MLCSLAKTAISAAVAFVFGAMGIVVLLLLYSVADPGERPGGARSPLFFRK